MIKDLIKKLPLARLGIIWCLLITIPVACLELLLALYIQPGSLKVLINYLISQPFLAFLNFLPFWLLTAGCCFILGNPFFSGAIIGGAGGILSLVNRTMIEKRDEPLSPKDFALIKEAGDAAQSYDLSISPAVILLLLCFVVAMVLLGIIVGGKPLLKKRWMNICLRLMGGAAFACVLVSCINTTYASKEIYNSFPVKSPYYIAGVYNQLGFPYCFCYNFNTYLVEKPEGYSTREVQEYIEQTETVAGEAKDINVVMVMNEAFSDITDNEYFDFPQDENPLKNYKKICESQNAISGHIVVPNYGAGTANTEFDVLTGMQTNMISESGASAFRVLNHDVDSVFREFLEDGYQTEFIHPGQSWFYNRQNVYQYFGAQELIFSERFEDMERKGNWVADSAVLEVMKEEFQAAIKQDKPYFNYTVTIQNHMSYSAKKYGDLEIPRVPLKKEVSPTAETMLSVYTQGVRDADAMLGKLVDFYSSTEEPVMLVFFGDHLPQLGDGYLCYNELGIEIGEGENVESTLATYETPYLIWVNDAAAGELDFQKAREALELPDGNVINANYLGAMVLELTGRGYQEPFFAYINQARRELPVFHNGAGISRDGEYFAEIPEENQELIHKLRFWEYYKLKVQ